MVLRLPEAKPMKVAQAARCVRDRFWTTRSPRSVTTDASGGLARCVGHSLDPAKERTKNHCRQLRVDGNRNRLSRSPTDMQGRRDQSPQSPIGFRHRGKTNRSARTGVFTALIGAEQKRSTSAWPHLATRFGERVTMRLLWRQCRCESV